MKIQKLGICLALPLALLASCSKSRISEKDVKPSIHSNARTTSLRACADDPLTIINDREWESEQDKKEYLARYCFGLAFKEHFNDEIRDFIFNECSTSETEAIDIATVFNQFPEFEENINNYLSNDLPEGLPYDFSSVALIEEALTVDPADPVNLEVNVPNLLTASGNESAILAFGLELEDEIEYKDQYFGWDLLTAGSPIAMTEGEVVLIASPIFNVGKRSASERARNMADKSENKNTATYPWDNNDRITIKRFRIYKRFESAGESEVCYGARFFAFPATNLGGEWIDNFSLIYSGHNNPNDFVFIKNVTKDHADGSGEWQNANVKLSPFFPMWVGTTQYTGLLWNTYERDWLEAKRKIASSKINGNEMIVYGRMSAAHHTYYYTPDNANTQSAWYIHTNISNIMWNATSHVFGTGNYESEIEFDKSL